MGSDIDLLAGMLSEVKCKAQSRQKYDKWRKGFGERLREDFQEISREWTPGIAPRLGTQFLIGKLDLLIPSFPGLSYWFPPQLITALATVAQAAHKCRDDHFERVALIALSASIIAKWPNTLSYAMDVDHTRPHRRLQRFGLDHVLSTYLGRLDRTIASLGEMHRIYGESRTDGPSAKATVVYPHDARTPVPNLVPESQTLVVTSPPYFNAVDYPRAHRLSVCWMNGYATPELVSRRKYVGLRYAPAFEHDEWLKAHPSVRKAIPVAVRREESVCRRLCAFYLDLAAVLRCCWTSLRPGGHAVFVIANNVIKGERIKSHRILGDLAKEVGFAERRIDTRPIAALRRRFPVGPFGFDGPMTHEYLVVVRKPRRQPGAAGGHHARPA